MKEIELPVLEHTFEAVFSPFFFSKWKKHLKLTIEHLDFYETWLVPVKWEYQQKSTDLIVTVDLLWWYTCPLTQVPQIGKAQLLSVVTPLEIQIIQNKEPPITWGYPKILHKPEFVPVLDELLHEHG